MNDEKQWIGRWGENLFEGLCIPAKVTHNVSRRDDYGWDAIIEFPPRKTPALSLDMQPGHLSAAIQVKATRRKSRSISISLRNALNHVHAPMPQFLVLAVQSGGEARIYAKHVWRELIGNWLKAARSADAAGRLATNKVTVTVTFGPEDEHSADLMSWIEAQIRSVPEPYAASKKGIVDQVGFEDGHGKAEMTLTLENADQLIDLQLGLLGELKANRFTFTSERFGILGGRPEIDLNDCSVTITPEGQAGILRFGLHAGGSISLPALIYDGRSDTSLAIRIATPSFELVYGPRQRKKASARLEAGRRYPQIVMRSHAHLMSSTQQTPIDLSVQIAGQVMPLGRIHLSNDADHAAWTRVAHALDTMNEIAKDAGTPGPEISLLELERNALPLQVLAAVGGYHSVRIEYTPSSEDNHQIDGFLAYAVASAGQLNYALVAHRPVVSDDTKKGRRRVTFGAARLLWGTIASSPTQARQGVEYAYEQQLERLSANGQMLALGDLENLANDRGRERDIISDLPNGRRSPLIRRGRGKSSKGRRQPHD